MSATASQYEFDWSVYFNEQEYLANKAGQMNGTSVQGRTNWSASEVSVLLQSAGLTALTHFQRFGAFEDVNPSSLFDVSSYYDAKAEKLTSLGYQGKSWSGDEARTLFQQAGLDPLTHYSLYGVAENLFPVSADLTKTVYSSANAIGLSGNVAIDSLATNKPAGFSSANWNWNDLATTQGNVIYYMFADSVDDLDYYDAAKVANFGEFNENQKEGSRQALNELSQITGIQFVETTSPNQANITFFGCVYNGGGSSYQGGTLTTSRDYKLNVFIDNTVSSNSDLRYGSGNYFLIQHEIGHAFNLKHPFEGSVTLPASLSTNDYTLMAYTSAQYPNPSWYGATTAHYGPYDIAALQYMYGTDGLGGNEGWVKA